MIVLGDVNCELILEQIKLGYPNTDDGFMNVPKPHSLPKWMEAVKIIYSKKKEGFVQNEVVEQVTSSWSPQEAYDFVHWLRFYQAGNHMKYALAQNWYQGNNSYLLLNKNAPEAFEEAKEQGEQEMTEAERAEIIANLRKKIVSRLDSIEKLIRSDRGEIMAGAEQDKLLESVYTLKKQINSLKKRSFDERTYQDMMIRESNILEHQGFFKAAAFLSVAANAPTEPPNVSANPVIPPVVPGTGSPSNQNEIVVGNPPPVTPSTTPTPVAPPPPNNSQGEVGGFNNTPIPGNDGNTPSNIPAAGEPKKPNEGLDHFVENLAEKGMKEKTHAKDTLHVEDDVLEVEDDVLMVEDNQDKDYSSSDLVAKGQTNPNAITTPENVKKDLPPEGIGPKDPKAEPETDSLKDFDSIIDSAFSQITVGDVVKRLESIANVYRTRELSRQLSIIDLMLDRLGVAPLLSSMTEVINRSLDSSNYILTRLEDILGKLRGTMTTEVLDLSNPASGEAANTPEALALKAKLEKDLDTEQKRKDQRKEMEDLKTEQAVVAPETPNVSLDDKPDLPPAAPPKTPPVPPA